MCSSPAIDDDDDDDDDDDFKSFYIHIQSEKTITDVFYLLILIWNFEDCPKETKFQSI